MRSRRIANCMNIGVISCLSVLGTTAAHSELCPSVRQEYVAQMTGVVLGVTDNSVLLIKTDRQPEPFPQSSTIAAIGAQFSELNPRLLSVFAGGRKIKCDYVVEYLPKIPQADSSMLDGVEQFAQVGCCFFEVGLVGESLESSYDGIYDMMKAVGD